MSTTFYPGAFVKTASSGLVAGPYVPVNGYLVLFSATISTGGRQVEMGMIPDGSGNPATFTIAAIGGGWPEGYFTLERDGVIVARFGTVDDVGAIMNGVFPPGVIRAFDDAPAGTHTYEFRAYNQNSVSNYAFFRLNYLSMFLQER